MPAPLSPQTRRTPTNRNNDLTPSKLKTSAGEATSDKIKPPEIGNLIGQSNNPSVFDKVRTWQTQGGGVVTEFDGVRADPDDEPRVKIDTTPVSPSRSNILDPGNNEAAAPSPVRPISRGKESDAEGQHPRIAPQKVTYNELDDDIKNASAPKKRVVSDEHWRNNKFSPKAETRTTPKTQYRSAWVRPARRTSKPTPKGPEIVDWPTKDAPAKEPVGTDGIRVYATRRGRKSEHSKSTDDTDTRRKSLSGKSAGKSEEEEPVVVTRPSPPKERFPKHRDRRKSRSPRAERTPEDEPRIVRKVYRHVEDEGLQTVIDEPVTSSMSPRAEPIVIDEAPRQRGPSRRVRVIAEDCTLGSTQESRHVETRKILRQRSPVSAPETTVADKVPRKRRSGRRVREPVEERPLYSPQGTHSAEKRKSAPRRSPVSTPSATESDIIPYDEPGVLDKAPRTRGSSRRRHVRVEDRDENHALDTSQEIRYAERRKTARRISPSSAPSTIESDLIPPPPAPYTPPKVYGNRIEAWLGSTPDPFNDTVSELARAAEDVPLPPPSDFGSSRQQGNGERRTRRASDAHQDFIDTDDTIEASKSTSNHHTAPVAVEVERSPQTPGLTLKRSGAKRNLHSPTKDRSKAPLGEDPSSTDDAASSAASSSVDASAIDLPHLPLRPRQGGFPVRRPFPSTGKRLSTIASVETFNTKLQATAPSVSEGSEVTVQPNASNEDTLASESGDTFDANELSGVKRRSKLQRKLTRHEDLMSVLSLPRAGSKSIVSARSIRTNKSRLATATVEDIMKELASDEAKYMRELRTLVDGVIPVLLTCVLSKSDSALAAGLFRQAEAAKNDASVTKPIVDMGVALERLRSVHKRIPKEDAGALLSWAQGAARVYADYVKAWRLGFQDVVVNLAPASGTASKVADKLSTISENSGREEGLPTNEEGYVINGEGERVDVAFLLKRPLIRLKYLAKTFKGINILKPSEQAERTSAKFQDLVVDARKRANEERARLEDDAAALIDPTRARDPRSLAPLAGVSIDATRCVRARDYFDLHLSHSTGQVVDCRVEILIRDDAPGRGSSGDVLICEADTTGRWLFFPPIQLGRISARNGDLEGEIVVMIRGQHSGGQEWQELMTLQTDDEQVGFEWVQMLGLNPVPPKPSSDQSYIGKSQGPASSHGSSLVSAATGSTMPMKSRTPSPREVEVPIGEQAGTKAKQWGTETPERDGSEPTSPETTPSTPPSKERARLQKKSKRSPVSPPLPLSGTYSVENEHDASAGRQSSRVEALPEEHIPRSIDEAMTSPEKEPSTPLKRMKAKRYRSSPHSPASPRSSKQLFADHQPTTQQPKASPRTMSERPTCTSTASTFSQSSKGYSVWLPSSQVNSDTSDSDLDDDDEGLAGLSTPKAAPARPQLHRRASSVPSVDLPTIPKLRKSSQPSTPVKETPRAELRTGSLPEARTTEVPKSAPAKLQKKRPEVQKADPTPGDPEKPPAPPMHRSLSPVQLKGPSTLPFTPTPPGYKSHRRSSSPLKHEYQPSTATESSTESDSLHSDDDLSATSESSEDDFEDNMPTPLRPLRNLNPLRKVSPPTSMYTSPDATLSPSQSASQSPYRTVPHNAGKSSKTIASIFSWSDKGLWESLHRDECSIVVSPGLIEAFEMTAAHSRPTQSSSSSTDSKSRSSTNSERPLVALELTPLVPLRRGTALDISIRSPPTSNSRIKSGNNIMFRSRNPEECEALYSLINTARINNPTYIALQNARGPYAENSWAAAMDRRNNARSASGGGSSWWHFGGSLRSRSYRASSTRAPSVTAQSESSVGTMQTAFSALKRFSAGGRLFDLARSTINSRDGSGSRSTGSHDDWSGGSGSNSGTSTPAAAGYGGAMPLGIRDTKIRLYVRESQSKWRDLGSARLSIMQPGPRNGGGGAANNPGSNAPASPKVLGTSGQKRILVIGKAKGECMLDVTLGESCFERVARTGIAVSVWEDVVGPSGEVGTVGATGGVGGQRVKVYMIQLKSERECAYSFSLLGKLRY